PSRGTLSAQRAYQSLPPELFPETRERFTDTFRMRNLSVSCRKPKDRASHPRPLIIARFYHPPVHGCRPNKESPIFHPRIASEAAQESRCRFQAVALLPLQVGDAGNPGRAFRVRCDHAEGLDGVG